ncbi:TPA: hypothetical protein ACGO55_002269, partial [Streptococcus suis]
MYFNRKNSQQKNWRMIKKGKHFLFGCALVFAIGATANVASAETVVSDTTVDQAQQVTATSESASSETATSTTAVSEEATSTTVASEVVSETVASSETASTTSEVATSETVTDANSEAASSETSAASTSETASSETSTSATEVAASETSSTASATSVANRTAYIGYEVQYTTSSGEVVGKTANIVAADTTEAVATATLTVSATDVPAGYELAAEQAYSLTQQISENQINILSFAVVKKSEEEEIAASQLENKTPLLQAIAEAEALTSEATRLLATSQKENSSLAVAADATKAVTAEARTVLKDATASEEQVQATTSTVQASSVSLGEELAKLSADGIVTAQLSSVTGLANVVDQYNFSWDSQSVTGRNDAGFELVTDANGKRILVYKYNLADTTAFTMNDVLTQLNATPKDANAGLRTLDGTEKSKLESATDGYSFAGTTAQLNGQAIDFLDIVNPTPLWGGRQVVGSTEGTNANYSTFYVPGTTDIGTAANSVTVGGSNGVDAVTFTDRAFQLYPNQVDRQKLYIRSVETSYEGGTGSAIDTDTDTNTIPVYMVGYKEATDQYNITWDNQSVTNRSDIGFEMVTDANGKRILVYKYDLDDSTAFTMNDVLSQLNAIPKDANSGLRTLDGTEKAKLENSSDGYSYSGNTAQLNGQTIDFLDIVNPDPLWGGRPVVSPITDANANYSTFYIPGTTDIGTKTTQISVGGTNGTSAVSVNGSDTVSLYDNQVDRQKLYIRSTPASTEDTTTSSIDTDTDTDTIPVYMVGYKANQAPMIANIGADGTQLKTEQDTTKYLFVFGTTEGTTETETGAIATAPVANKNNATATVAMSDADGTIASVSYDDGSAAANPQTTLGSNLTLGKDGKLEGSFEEAAGGFYTRRVTVTDNNGATAASNAFYTYAYTDKEVDTTPIAKEEGTAVTEAEVFAKLAIATTSAAEPNTGLNIPTVPETEYTRTIVGYRAVGSKAVTDATVDALPTTGEYEVKVRTRNIYGQDIYNWVTVKYTDTIAPEAPTVEAKADGSVTVTPSQTAGDDTKTVDITYTDETGTSQTVTVTKADDGTWSVPANSGVTVDATTGTVTIPADQVKDGSTVSATSTDEAGNTSTPATDYVTATPTTTEVTDPANLTEDEKAKVKEEVEKSNPNLPTGTTVEVGNDGTVTITYPDGSTDTIPGTDTVAKDSTAPEAPVVTAKPDGSVTVTPAGDDTTTVEITYTDENGVEKTVTATKAEDGTWSVPADSGVTVDPTTGVVTIPADQVKDSSEVTAVSKDEVGNPSTQESATTPATTDNVTPVAPAVTEVTDPTNLTDDEKAKVKEEVENANPDLPTGTTVEVGNDGTVTITYPDG